MTYGMGSWRALSSLPEMHTGHEPCRGRPGPRVEQVETCEASDTRGARRSLRFAQGAAAAGAIALPPWPTPRAPELRYAAQFGDSRDPIPGNLDHGFMRRSYIRPRDMKAIFSNSCTSCSFFSSAP